MFNDNYLPIAIFLLDLLDLGMCDPCEFELRAEEHDLTCASLLVDVLLDQLFHLVQDDGRVGRVRQLVVLEPEVDLNRILVHDLEKYFYCALRDRQVRQWVRELAYEFVDGRRRGNELRQEHETVCPLRNKLVYYLDSFRLHKFRFLNLYYIVILTISFRINYLFYIFI